MNSGRRQNKTPLEEVLEEWLFFRISRNLSIAEVEEQHEIQYRKLLKNLNEGNVFKKDIIVK